MIKTKIKIITKEDIQLEYNNLLNNSDTYFLNSRKDKEDFRQFINGLYQAEGTMGAYFPRENSLSIRFSFSMGQNYSSEAVKVFLNLKKVLGVGAIKLEFDSKNQVHIRYVVSNTKEIFIFVLPYFSLLYGQKRRDKATLEKIYKISLDIATILKKGLKPYMLIVNEFINLVYSINPNGQERKLPLINKLTLFNCESITYYDKVKIEENNNLPTKLFIIGLFLGDGSFGFVFDNPPLRSPKFYIKIVFNFAAQSYTNSNIELLELVAKSMGLEPQIYVRKTGMIGLEYRGDTVYNYIMPFLNEHFEWLFWRKKQFINIQKIVAIFKNKGHLNKEGLQQIVT